MATQALVFDEAPAREPSRARELRLLERARDRIDLAGVLIDQIDLASAVHRIRGFLDSGQAHQIVTVNLDFISIAQRDPAFRETINHADLAVADGMPLVWVSRLKRQPLARRITGVELVHESCQLAAEMGRSVFLLGAASGVAEIAARRLEDRYPGIRVADVYAPPFGALTRAEDEHIVQRINDACPDFLFVALGAPRQDLWIGAHHGRLHAPVAMGVGCVLDLLAGVVRRAPGWMQGTGLEWSYRLVQEPRRLWRRYLVDDLPMLGRLLVSSALTQASPLERAMRPETEHSA
jgi:N-acetylglucosaminyldiphosphoundecaprenol N-acetyl-beta-D-mannosaminyltransferase